MLRTRVIPVLLVDRRRCVKTERFRRATYLGDLKNIVRIFNDKEVDELVILDISANRERPGPDFDFLAEVVVECFMPVCYGGGISRRDDVRTLFSLGIEKIAVNSVLFDRPEFLSELADEFGRQSIVASIDVGRDFLGRYRCYSRGGSRNSHRDPEEFAEEAARSGAGEILLNSIVRDGTMSGYDLDLIQRVSRRIDIPLIACGGAGCLEDFGRAVIEGGASAAAGGSFFVFQGPHRAVLISYPARNELERLFAENGAGLNLGGRGSE